MGLLCLSAATLGWGAVDDFGVGVGSENLRLVCLFFGLEACDEGTQMVVGAVEEIL